MYSIFINGCFQWSLFIKYDLINTCFQLKIILHFLHFSEDPVNYLQQLFPDAARNDLEQALESCKGDANQAAEFLLQGNETGPFNQ